MLEPTEEEIKTLEEVLSRGFQPTSAKVYLKGLKGKASPEECKIVLLKYIREVKSNQYCMMCEGQGHRALECPTTQKIDDFVKASGTLRATWSGMKCLLNVGRNV